MTAFFRDMYHTKSHKLGPFNLAVRWKRAYRGKQAKDPWYLLTNLDSLSKTLQLYSARFGIEAMFKDCKTGGYNIEKTKGSPDLWVINFSNKSLRAFTVMSFRYFS